ncbi:MAG: hypothetical protein ACI9U0_001657 [Flavobacteriales bacterium]|jgi:hypothetical protein
MDLSALLLPEDLLNILMQQELLNFVIVAQNK